MEWTVQILTAVSFSLQTDPFYLKYQFPYGISHRYIELLININNNSLAHDHTDIYCNGISKTWDGCDIKCTFYVINNLVVWEQEKYYIMFDVNLFMVYYLFHTLMMIIKTISTISTTQHWSKISHSSRICWKKEKIWDLIWFCSIMAYGKLGKQDQRINMYKTAMVNFDDVGKNVKNMVSETKSLKAQSTRLMLDAKQPS